MDLNAEGMAVQGNAVGVDDSHLVPLPNRASDLRVQSSPTPASANIIGAVDAGGPGRKPIAYNGGTGLVVVGGTRNTMRGNSIHDNGRSESRSAGLTKPLADDPGDANGYTINSGQNFPILESADAARQRPPHPRHAELAPVDDLRPRLLLEPGVRPLPARLLAGRRTGSARRR